MLFTWPLRMPFTCTSSLLGSPPVCGNEMVHVRTERWRVRSLSHASAHTKIASDASTVTPTLISDLRLIAPRGHTGWIGPSLVPSMN